MLRDNMVTRAIQQSFGHEPHGRVYSERATMAYANQSPCKLCPRQCGARRNDGEVGACGVGKELLVAGIRPHFAEESCISGQGGSAAVFFSGCSLNCVFCQNEDVARARVGLVRTPQELANALVRAQAKGMQNVNLVTPTHFIAQVIDACILARQQGLIIPVVYNTSGYEDVSILRLLEDVIDVYLPDFKALGFPLVCGISWSRRLRRVRQISHS